MAKEKPPPEPPDDIPAWFMTYSDVITLLMTFFILLLTFSTTEPERFEKVTASFAGSAGATGVAGHEHDKQDRDSWSQRVRPRAARVALQGSEMPPIIDAPSNQTIGRGLEAVNEEQAKKDVMKSYAFESPLSQLVDENNRVTHLGVQLASKLAAQVRKLPIHCALEVSSLEESDKATAFAHHLYHVEKVRPGQVCVGVVENANSNSLRIVVERYEM